MLRATFSSSKLAICIYLSGFLGDLDCRIRKMQEIHEKPWKSPVIMHLDLRIPLDSLPSLPLGRSARPNSTSEPQNTAFGKVTIHTEFNSDTNLGTPGTSLPTFHLQPSDFWHVVSVGLGFYVEHCWTYSIASSPSSRYDITSHGDSAKLCTVSVYRVVYTYIFMRLETCPITNKK